MKFARTFLVLQNQSVSGKSNKLVFDPKKIERLGKIYDISLEVKP